jgi:MoaA/NifB/PqqE/SkfB family radical SAM enzyme
MERYTQEWGSRHIINMLSNVRRRQGWFTAHASPRQYANLLLALAEFATKRETTRAWPVLVKVDISPLCNLSCTYCVHARPTLLADNEGLGQQTFKAGHKMPVDQFGRLVKEIGGKSMAVSLYYIGDPLVHPNLEEMCGLARASRLNVHISTNFSFNLTDERLKRLLTCGLTHLTVCVESLHQETYGQTRIGGRIRVVLDNLDRLLRLRRELGLAYPRVEVQFIKFQHNLPQLEEVAAWCAARGVDQFTNYWGNLHNYVDVAPTNLTVFGPRANRLVPHCSWPYFSLQVKYNGDVIPCCYHRVSEQYREGGDQRVIGNVFETSVAQVWHSPAYQRLRRLVANPARAAMEPELTETFCGACPTVFHTDVAQHELVAHTHKWEDVFIYDDRQRVVRR